MHRSCQFGKFKTNNNLNLIIEGNMSLNFPTVPISGIIFFVSESASTRTYNEDRT